MQTELTAEAIYKQEFKFSEIDLIRLAVWDGDDNPFRRRLDHPGLTVMDSDIEHMFLLEQLNCLAA